MCIRDSDGTAQSGFNYDIHENVTSVIQEVTRITSGGSTSDLSFTAFNTDEDDTLILDAGADVQVNLSVSDFRVFDGDPANGGVEILNGTNGLSISESGGVVTISGLPEGAFYQITSDETFEALEIGHAGGGAFTLGDIAVGTLNTQAPFNLDIPVIGIDGDGDQVGSSLAIAFQPSAFVVGSNADDEVGNFDPFVVGSDFGDISGTDVSDILIGDSGGAVETNFVANYVLLLDTSGSMDTNDRLAALQNAVEATLNDLANSGGEDVRVYLVEYSTGGNQIGTGVYDLVVDGVIQTDVLEDAIAAVNALDAGGRTNYEAGLQTAIDLIQGTDGTTGVSQSDGTPLLTGEDGQIVINQAYFFSDGAPNQALEERNGINTFADSENRDADEALNEILGINPTGGDNGDDTNEVALLDALLNGGTPVPPGSSGFINAIGIQLDEGSTGLNNLSLLNTVLDENGDPIGATNVDMPSDLTQILADLNPLNDLGAVGDDVINLSLIHI